MIGYNFFCFTSKKTTWNFFSRFFISSFAKREVEWEQLRLRLAAAAAWQMHSVDIARARFLQPLLRFCECVRAWACVRVRVSKWERERGANKKAGYNSLQPHTRSRKGRKGVPGVGVCIPTNLTVNWWEESRWKQNNTNEEGWNLLLCVLCFGPHCEKKIPGASSFFQVWTAAHC